MIAQDAGLGTAHLGPASHAGESANDSIEGDVRRDILRIIYTGKFFAKPLLTAFLCLASC